MQVSILEPKGVIWQGAAKEVSLPAIEGEVCILDFHQPFLIRLGKGQMRLDSQRTAIKEGIASMQQNELRVFVET